MHFKRLLFTACITATTLVAGAQKKTFSQEELLAGKLPKDFTYTLPQVVKWVDDEHVELYQKIYPDTAYRTYTMDVKTGTLTVKNDGGAPSRGPGMASPYAKSIISKDNDLFVKAGGVEKRITNDKAEEKNPMFSPDSNYVAFTRNNNLFTVNLATGKENQLTTDGTATTLNGYASWVYFEEIFSN